MSPWHVLDLAHGVREKVEVCLSEQQYSVSGKKPYQRPTFTRKSISEVGRLFRRKTVGRETLLEGTGASALAEVPLLLVEGYGGDLNFIRPVARAPARGLELFSIMKGVGWLEMQFAGVEGAAPTSTFLLLDQRHRHRGERGLLESIGHNPDLNQTVPKVILATSLEQFLGWKGIDPKQCWQLRGRLSSEDLSAALRSFLHLCSMFANWPAEEEPALDPTSDPAVSGKINKE